jgi:hypothetical protein
MNYDVLRRCQESFVSCLNVTVLHPVREEAGTRVANLGGTRFESPSRYQQPSLIFLVSVSVSGKFQDWNISQPLPYTQSCTLDTVKPVKVKKCR